jgi:hypothetical protein
LVIFFFLKKKKKKKKIFFVSPPPPHHFLILSDIFPFFFFSPHDSLSLSSERYHLLRSLLGRVQSLVQAEADTGHAVKRCDFSTAFDFGVNGLVQLGDADGHGVGKGALGVEAAAGEFVGLEPHGEIATRALLLTVGLRRPQKKTFQKMYVTI